MDIDVLIRFLGWCLVVNLAILSVTLVSLVLFRETIISIHSQLFNLQQKTLSSAYFTYIAVYKLFVLFFNLVPYLVLNMMY